MSVVTLQQAKDWLSITNTSEDAVLTLIIAGVDAAIRNYTGISFGTTTVVVGEVQDGTLTDVVVPEKFPVISVQQLMIGAKPDGTGGSLVDPENYDLDPDGAYITLRYEDTPRSRGAVRLDYTAGYASVPGDVVQAALLSVEAFRARRARKTVDIASRGKEGESESYQSAWDTKSGLPKAAMGLLAPYLQMEVPTSMAPRGR